MFEFLFMDQPLSNMLNIIVSIISVVAVIALFWCLVSVIVGFKKPEWGFKFFGFGLKIVAKISVWFGKGFWKGKKVLSVVSVTLALFFTTTIMLPDYSHPFIIQIIIASAISITATTALVAAVKRKRDLALKLLGLTGIPFLSAWLWPSIVTLTGEVNLLPLFGIGGATIIGIGAAIAYTIHQKRLAKENAEKELLQELELELGKNKAPLISLEKQPMCLRVARIPENYMENLREHAESQLHALRDPGYASLSNTESHIFSGVPQFQGLIKALGNVRVAVRTDFHKGMATIRFLAEQEHLLKLKRVLESHIPGIELKTEAANSNRPYSPASVVRLENAVPNSPTPLRPLYDHFIQNVLNGFVDIYLDPHGDFRDAVNNFWMNYSYKQFKKREKEDGDAINYSDEQKMQRMRKTLEEGRTRVGVYAAVYNNSDGNGNSSVDALASVLASGFRSANRSGSAKVSPQFSHTLKKFQGIHMGANLELTNLEAAAVLQIQIPVETQGFRVDKIADFPVSSPGRGGEEGLWLGWLTRGGKVLEEGAYLNLESVNQHVLIGGSTGSGKSTELAGLIDGLWKKGIPVVLIEPSKQEHRRLSRLFPVNIFTVGDEPVSPLRLNPLEVPEKVGFESHISSLVNIFHYAFDMLPPLPEFFRSSLYDCYKHAGWKTASKLRGIDPCLLNLLDAMRRMVKSSTYEPRVKMNIESAGITRIGDFTIGSLGAMMLGFDSTPFSVFRERPTIIELDAVGDDEKSLIASLILLWVYSHLRAEGPSKKLRMVVIVEEAHWIAEDRGRDPSKEGRSRGALSNLFVSRLLKEARGYGLGVVLVDQNPVRLSEDAVKNTNTKLIFALPDASDRRRLGESIGLNEEQINSLVSMERGQFVLWTQGHNPTRIQGINVEKEMKEKGLATTYPADEEVREYMEPFFEKHPNLRWIHPHVFSDPSEIYHPPVSDKNKPSKKENKVLHEVRDVCKKICTYPRWTKIYNDLTTREKRENHILQTAQNIAKRYKIPDIKQVVQALREVIKKQNI